MKLPPAAAWRFALCSPCLFGRDATTDARPLTETIPLSVARVILELDIH